MEYCVDKKGDTTITLRRIVIRNIKDWEKVKKDDMKESRMSLMLKDGDMNPFDRRSTMDWSKKRLIGLNGMTEAEKRHTFTATGVE